jgi:hypothetical protein
MKSNESNELNESNATLLRMLSSRVTIGELIPGILSISMVSQSFPMIFVAD